jgi:hypothetical protein
MSKEKIPNPPSDVGAVAIRDGADRVIPILPKTVWRKSFCRTLHWVSSNVVAVIG